MPSQKSIYGGKLALPPFTPSHPSNAGKMLKRIFLGSRPPWKLGKVILSYVSNKTMNYVKTANQHISLKICNYIISSSSIKKQIPDQWYEVNSMIKIIIEDKVKFMYFLWQQFSAVPWEEQ